MHTSKISIARLFNLGSYEHVRYEITIDLAKEDSASKAITALEKILECLKPERNQCVKTRSDLCRDAYLLAEKKAQLLTMDESEFRRRHGHFEGTPNQYVARIEAAHLQEIAKRTDYETRCKKARALLDNLGGAETFKDCKLDWEEQGDFGFDD